MVEREKKKNGAVEGGTKRPGVARDGVGRDSDWLGLGCWTRFLPTTDGADAAPHSNSVSLRFPQLRRGSPT